MMDANNNNKKDHKNYYNARKTEIIQIYILDLVHGHIKRPKILEVAKFQKSLTQSEYYNDKYVRY